MRISSGNPYAYSQVYNQAGAAKTAKAEAAAEKTEQECSTLDRLKQTFSNVNFVTGKDPFAAKDVRNNGRNTVFLDSAALRKLESDPRYAARVFAAIESNMEIVGRGYSYREGDRMYTLQAGALNLSFYGSGENSKLVATMMIYDADGKPDSPSSPFSFGESPGKAIHRWITDTSNKSLMKWFDAFSVPSAERQYYDFDQVWSEVQAARK